MKKIPIFIIAIVLIIVIFNIIGYIAGEFQISVERYDADVTITDTGDMKVEETWVVNYPQGYTVGYRDIYFRKTSPEANPFRIPATDIAALVPDVKVEVRDSAGRVIQPTQVGFSYNNDRDERGLPIECEPRSSQCDSIFVFIETGMDRQMTFKYEYTIEGAVTKFNDTAMLNWNLVEYFGAGIKSSTVNIHLPGIQKDDYMVWGHGVSVGRIYTENEKITLEMSKLKADHRIEFLVLMPEDSFSVEPKNFVNLEMFDEIVAYEVELARQTNVRITVANIVLYGTIIMVLTMIAITYYVYIKYDKEHKPEFTGQYYRDLPKEYSPTEMSYLYYFRKINNEDVTATMLDLIRRNYLFLDTAKSAINDKNPDFRIILNKEIPLSDLLPHERHLIDWFINIIGNGSEVSIKQIENYPKGSYQKAMKFQEQAKLFVRKAKETSSKHDFFEPRLGSSKGKISLFVAIPILYIFICLITQTIYIIDNSIPMIISIIVIIIYIIYISTIDKRSVNGNEDFVKWKAFRDFLLDFGNLRDYPMPGIIVWEHYLVYATSLKVADKVMQQLEVRLPKEELTSSSSTYLGFGHRYYGFHLGYTLGRINNTMHTARTNSTATISAHHAAKVGSGGKGGGFSGGRSFGGGGGGFRGR